MTTTMVKPPEKKLPPLPKGRLLSGNLKQIQREGKKFYLNYTQEYNGIFRFRIFHVTAYVVNELDTIEEILVSKRRNFIKGKSWNTTRLFGGNGLLTSEGEFWSRPRRLTQPAFHKQKLQQYAQTTSEFSSRMINQWKGGRHAIYLPICAS